MSNNTTEPLTTKAAVCPNCSKYHLITTIDNFKNNVDTRRDFAEMMIDGFEIIEVTTQQAKNNFGYCKPQPTLFDQ